MTAGKSKFTSLYNTVVVSVGVSAWKRCSFRLYPHVFVGGLMSYLRDLCLFVHSGVQLISFCVFVLFLSRLVYPMQGRIQDFKLGGGAHLKKLRRAEGGANIFGVFRVKNHDFTPKNLIFFNFRGGGGAGCPPTPPPLDPPLLCCQFLWVLHF